MIRTLSDFAEGLGGAALWARGFRSRRVRTSVGDLHAVEARGHGDLPPVVLIHGFSASSVHFLPMLAPLRRRCRAVLAPDLPGHGRSVVPRDLDANVLAEALVEALDAWIDEPAVLVGTSMGGAAAVRYAARRPRKVRGLVLVSPGGAPMEDDELESLRTGFRMDRHEDALDFVDRLFELPPSFRRFVAHGVRERFRRPEMRSLIQGLGPHHLLTREEVAGLRCPTLLLWGREERILPASGLAFFREALPSHAQVDEPDRWGHSPFLNRPAEVVDRVIAFLEAIAAADREPASA